MAVAQESHYRRSARAYQSCLRRDKDTLDANGFAGGVRRTMPESSPQFKNNHAVAIENCLTAPAAYAR